MAWNTAVSARVSRPGPAHPAAQLARTAARLAKEPQAGDHGQTSGGARLGLDPRSPPWTPGGCLRAAGRRVARGQRRGEGRECAAPERRETGCCGAPYPPRGRPAATRFPSCPGSEPSPSRAPSTFPDPRGPAPARQAAGLKAPSARSRRGRPAPGDFSQPSKSFAIALLRILAVAGNPNGPTGLREGGFILQRGTHSDRPEISAGGGGGRGSEVSGRWNVAKTKIPHPCTPPPPACGRRELRATVPLASAICRALPGLGLLIPLWAKNKI